MYVRYFEALFFFLLSTPLVRISAVSQIDVILRNVSGLRTFFFVWFASNMIDRDFRENTWSP